MRRFLPAIVTFLVLVGQSDAQIKIKGKVPKGPETAVVQGGVGDLIFIEAQGDPKLPMNWLSLDDGLKMIPAKYLNNTNLGMFYSPTKGIYRVVAWQKDNRDAPAFVFVSVGDAPIPGPGPGPEPIPPPIPGPGPIPKPPVPEPTPDAPITDAGNRVLIVYETAEIRGLPTNQASIFADPSIRQYLDSKCIVGPDGKTKEWRMYDKDIELVKERDLWKNAMKRSLSNKDFKIPWVLISTGKTGYEGPLPADVPAMQALLKRYFEPK